MVALVHGQAVAIFRVDEGTVHALANHDPFDRHAVLAKGIVGRQRRRAVRGLAGAQARASTCAPASAWTTQHVSVAAYDVKIVEGVVLVGHRKTAAA